MYDPRTLYEKLKEKKDQKQAAFDEKYSIRKLEGVGRNPYQTMPAGPGAELALDTTWSRHAIPGKLPG